MKNQNKTTKTLTNDVLAYYSSLFSKPLFSGSIIVDTCWE